MPFPPGDVAVTTSWAEYLVTLLAVTNLMVNLGCLVLIRALATIPMMVLRTWPGISLPPNSVLQSFS